MAAATETAVWLAIIMAAGLRPNGGAVGDGPHLAVVARLPPAAECSLIQPEAEAWAAEAVPARWQGCRWRSLTSFSCGAHPQASGTDRRQWPATS